MAKLKWITAPDAQGNPVRYEVDGVDATTATAGQVLTADGNGGHYWGDIEAGDSVPTNVRQAILALFQNGVYTRDDMSDEVAVIQSWATEITSISVSPTTLNINGMSQETIVATTQPAGGIVSWSSSDESIATVSGGVVTPTGINGTCTITASCGGKSATCAVTVSGFATLLSIDAVYTQSETVYDTDSLNSLKSDLVVTANYDDDRSVPVTGYTLSGTLIEGTSTITVSYGGFTDTFTVTVTAASSYADPDDWLLNQSISYPYVGKTYSEAVTSYDGRAVYSSPITLTEGTCYTVSCSSDYQFYLLICGSDNVIVQGVPSPSTSNYTFLVTSNCHVGIVLIKGSTVTSSDIVSANVSIAEATQPVLSGLTWALNTAIYTNQTGSAFSDIQASVDARMLLTDGFPTVEPSQYYTVTCNSPYKCYGIGLDDNETFVKVIGDKAYGSDTFTFVADSSITHISVAVKTPSTATDDDVNAIVVNMVKTTQ